MAERRMFSKQIIDSDIFLDMPQTTQNLYFHLNMRADDEGFVNSPKKIMRMVGSNQNDLEVLIAKRYIITFESGVIVIKHWKLHNTIRKDRMNETLYKEEKAMLEEKINGAYTEIKLFSNSEMTPRKIAYKESSLPYSFDYKIKNQFYGKACPACGGKMVRDEYAGNAMIPSIQHNIPISKGGRHELGNISVICKKCNVSIKDNITPEYNSLQVIELWEMLTSDGQLTDTCPPSVLECNIDKSIIIESNKEGNKSPSRKKFIIPLITDLEEYCKEKDYTVDCEAFLLHYESNGWLVGKNKMKSWKAALGTWSKNSYGKQPEKRKEILKEMPEGLKNIWN